VRVVSGRLLSREGQGGSTDAGGRFPVGCSSEEGWRCRRRVSEPGARRRLLRAAGPGRVAQLGAGARPGPARRNSLTPMGMRIWPAPGGRRAKRPAATGKSLLVGCGSRLGGVLLPSSGELGGRARKTLTAWPGRGIMRFPGKGRLVLSPLSGRQDRGGRPGGIVPECLPGNEARSGNRRWLGCRSL